MKKFISILSLTFLCLTVFGQFRTIMVNTNGALANSDTNFFSANYAAAIAAGLGGSSGGGAASNFLNSPTIQWFNVGGSNLAAVVGVTNNVLTNSVLTSGNIISTGVNGTVGANVGNFNVFGGNGQDPIIFSGDFTFTNILIQMAMQYGFTSRQSYQK